MKAPVAQDGNYLPHGLNRVLDIRPLAQRSPVMQAKDRPVHRASQNSPGDCLRLPFPVFPNSTPQDTGESQPLLSASHAEPTDSERRAKVLRFAPGGIADRPLCFFHLRENELRRVKPKPGVRVRMIAVQVARRSDL